MMPHCLIEYSQSLTAQVSAQVLNDAVFAAAVKSGLFSPVGEDIRVRSQSFTDYRVGSGKAHFIHITIRLLQGRNDSEKHALNTAVGEAVAALELHNVQISCECVEIHSLSYFRAIL